MLLGQQHVHRGTRGVLTHGCKVESLLQAASSSPRMLACRHHQSGPQNEQSDLTCQAFHFGESWQMAQSKDTPREIGDMIIRVYLSYIQFPFIWCQILLGVYFILLFWLLAGAGNQLPPSPTNHQRIADGLPGGKASAPNNRPPRESRRMGVACAGVRSKQVLKFFGEWSKGPIWYGAIVGFGDLGLILMHVLTDPHVAP